MSLIGQPMRGHSYIQHCVSSSSSSKTERSALKQDKPKLCGQENNVVLRHPRTATPYMVGCLFYSSSCSWVSVERGLGGWQAAGVINSKEYSHRLGSAADTNSLVSPHCSFTYKSRKTRDMLPQGIQSYRR